MRNFIIIMLFSLILNSCTKSLDDYLNSEPEIINGFTVHWRPSSTQKQREVARTILNDMILVEGDYFVMGATPEQTQDARANEYPLVYIELSDYYICKHEITDEQFVIIANDLRNNDFESIRITWSDMEMFFKTLSDITSIKFDFPTEAQWEFAARGGKQSKGYKYPGSNDLEKVNSFDEEGSQVPNELGLYNMADKKSEFCKDFYDTYKETFYENPLITTGKYHVIRGGNYKYDSFDTGYKKDYTSNYLFSPIKGDKRLCRITARSYVMASTYYYSTSRAVINL